MRKHLPILLFLTLGLFIGSCSQSNDADPVNGSELLSTLQVDPQDGNKVCGERDDYSLIVIDEDHREIRLNVSRRRDTCTSYYGHLWYRLRWRRPYEGACVAVWDEVKDVLLTTAVEELYQEDVHISYSFQFEADEGESLIGSYFYPENLRHADNIGGWLEKGRLGDREGREEGTLPMEISQGAKLKSIKAIQD